MPGTQKSNLLRRTHRTGHSEQSGQSGANRSRKETCLHAEAKAAAISPTSKVHGIPCAILQNQRPALIPSVLSAFKSRTDEPSASSPFFRKTRVRQRKKNSGFWPRWNFSEKVGIRARLLAPLGVLCAHNALSGLTQRRKDKCQTRRKPPSTAGSVRTTA